METNKNKSGKEARREHKADDAPEVMDVLDAENDSEAEDSEASEQDLARDLEAAQAALEKEKKEYLFLMAEFDNYRKRVVKEKSEILRNGAEKVLADLLPIVDDFERGLAATADAEDAAAVRSGMELIYHKLVKYLESNGVKAMDSTGNDFDPELHEAIASIPAPNEELKGKVVDTTQKGYMINDKVLRHATGAVGQ